MPTYQYQCGKCGEELEVWQSITDEPLKRHSGCGGKLTKVFGAVGIVLKGSGFYRTDNPSSSRKQGQTSERSSSSSSESTSSSKDSKAKDASKGSSTKDSGSGTKPSKPATKSA